MGLASRIRGWDRSLSRYAQRELRSQSLSSIWSDDLFVGPRAASGASVNEESAQRLVHVFAAINLIAGSVATTPFHLYERVGDAKGERATDHPLYSVLRRRANPEMDALTFRELLTSHACAWGNGYARVYRDDAGRAREMYPLRPDRMVVSEVNGRRVYDYTDLIGRPSRFLPKDIFHLRLRGDHLVGWSPIRMARESLGVALAAEEFAARFYSNGAQPGVVIRHPGRLSKDAHKALKDSWADAHQGLSNAHRAAILEEGAGIEKIGIPPDDAQFIETRQFQAGEVATLYAIPPHMLGMVERSTSWGTGIEQQQIGFQTFTLLPYFTRWEYGVEMQLLSPTEAELYTAAHIIDNFQRADIRTRFQAYNTAVTTGWMNRAEVRARENLPEGPAELEEFLTPVAVAQKDEPAPQP